MPVEGTLSLWRVFQHFELVSTVGQPKRLNVSNFEHSTSEIILPTKVPREAVKHLLSDTDCQLPGSGNFFKDQPVVRKVWKSQMSNQHKATT